MAETPRVTVLIPAYNAARYIDQALKSVLAQEGVSYEILILDDGSSDDTVARARAYADPRVQVFELPHGGISRALNFGIARARGELVARMDADDVCLPGRFAKQVAHLDAKPAVSAVFSWITCIDQEGRPHKESLPIARFAGSLRRAMPARCVGIHPTMMIRRAVLAEVGYSVPMSGVEDYVLYLDLLARGHELETMHEVLLELRLHDTSYTADAHKRSTLLDRMQRARRYVLAAHLRAGHVNPFLARVAFHFALGAVIQLRFRLGLRTRLRRLVGGRSKP